MKTTFTTVFYKTEHVVALLFALSFQVLHAQNWEPVYFSETANFDVDGQVNGTFLYLYHFTTDGDTITGRFLPNLNEEAPCSSGNSEGCVTSNICKVATSSFLQEYAIFLPNGVVEFQNPDTFQIHSLAQLGETWIFKTDEIGNPVIAEVTDQYSGTVLGEIDSIKVVSVADGSTFHLSKNHGITYWSDAVVNFELSSIPARNLGGSNLSSASVFGFSPGDVFVYLNKSETGANEGFPNDFEYGSHKLMRKDVLEVNESSGTLLITIQSSSYSINYSNSNGNYTEQGLSESLISTVEIPLNEDCHIYQWPIGGVMPARIPTSIHTLSQSFGFPIFACNFDQDIVECNESELLGGTYPISSFSRTATGIFGNRTSLSSSMNLLNGPVLTPESSPLEVLYLDPRDFYDWETLSRCDFEFSESPSQVAVGETLHSETLDTEFVWHSTQTYSLGEGLGIVAFDWEYLGVGSWCMDRTVMIGYQKAGDDPFGFIPESLDLLTLSIGEKSTASTLNVFPNPASTTVRVDMPGVVLSHASIHDLQGRQLLDVRLQHNEPIIDVSDLPKGMYLIRVVTQNGEEFVKKLVVE